EKRDEHADDEPKCMDHMPSYRSNGSHTLRRARNGAKLPAYEIVAGSRATVRPSGLTCDFANNGPRRGTDDAVGRESMGRLKPFHKDSSKRTDPAVDTRFRQQAFPNEGMLDQRHWGAALIRNFEREGDLVLVVC